MSDFESFQQLNKALNKVVPATAQGLLQSLNDVYNSELSKLVNVAGAYARDYVTIQRLGTDSNGNVVDQTTSNGKHIANQQIVRHQADIKSLKARQEVFEQQLADLINLNNVKQEVSVQVQASGGIEILPLKVEQDEETGNSTVFIEFESPSIGMAGVQLYWSDSKGYATIGPGFAITYNGVMFSVVISWDVVINGDMCCQIAIGKYDDDHVKWFQHIFSNGTSVERKLSFTVDTSMNVISASVYGVTHELQSTDPLTLSGASSYPSVEKGAWVKESYNPYFFSVLHRHYNQLSFGDTFVPFPVTGTIFITHDSAQKIAGNTTYPYALVRGLIPAVTPWQNSVIKVEQPIVDVWALLTPTIKPQGLTDACDALLNMTVD